MSPAAPRLTPLVTAEDLAARVQALAATLDADRIDAPRVAIGVLKGAFLFHADLVRALADPALVVDFLEVRSYAGTSRGDTVSLVRDLSLTVEGCDVILVEDIVDTGHTLAFLRDRLAHHRPARVRTVSLLDKPSRREVDVAADLVGFTIPDRFVVGYGLDVDQRCRALPYLAVLDEA